MGCALLTYLPHADSVGEEGYGWSMIETVLVRLNDTYTPNGTFPVYGDEGYNGTRIGYDAAVCLELFEPYVVEVYNSTVGAPVSVIIVSKGKSVEDAPSQQGVSDELKGDRIEDVDVARELNSTGYVGLLS